MCVSLWALVFCVSAGIDILCLCGHFYVYVCLWTLVSCVYMDTGISCVYMDTCASFKMINFRITHTDTKIAHMHKQISAPLILPAWQKLQYMW